mmetsp:Transcript_1658/g.4840  ORF Transcript_1658/g.4840 Transcript_1658/m.4840 type:complete len:230 (+) Transcript_1658:2137-2826(+)
MDKYRHFFPRHIDPIYKCAWLNLGSFPSIACNWNRREWLEESSRRNTSPRIERCRRKVYPGTGRSFRLHHLCGGIRSAILLINSFTNICWIPCRFSGNLRLSLYSLFFCKSLLIVISKYDRLSRFSPLRLFNLSDYFLLLFFNCFLQPPFSLCLGLLDFSSKCTSGVDGLVIIANAAILFFLLCTSPLLLLLDRALQYSLFFLLNGALNPLILLHLGQLSFIAEKAPCF